MPRCALATRSILLLLCAGACGWSCGNAPSAPSGDVAGPLRVSAAITQSTIPPGSEATLLFTLANGGATDLELTFPSSCQILPYIRARDAVVHPSGGSWACLTVITTLPLRAGASVTREVRVRAAASAENPIVPLAPGDYTAYATVDATQYHLTSRAVSFAVR